VREDIPYLQIPSSEDTRLAELILRVQISLLKQGGIQYVNQISTGEDMWLRTENRLLTYREFCDMLRDPEARVWLDRILMFYLETGRRERNDRADNVISSIQELVTFELVALRLLPLGIVVTWFVTAPAPQENGRSAIYEPV
jgi:type II secretory pathway component PulF